MPERETGAISEIKEKSDGLQTLISSEDPEYVFSVISRYLDERYLTLFIERIVEEKRFGDLADLARMPAGELRRAMSDLLERHWPPFMHIDTASRKHEVALDWADKVKRLARRERAGSVPARIRRLVRQRDADRCQWPGGCTAVKVVRAC